MKTIKSIFRIYGISEVLIKENDKIEIIILKRTQNITLNRWINMINSLKQTYKKDVEFLLEKDAKEIYKDFSDFVLVKVNDNEQ